jgi:hypothetical protein
MTYQQILANINYRVLSEDKTHLVIGHGSDAYLFYKEDNELICFDLNQFKKINISLFYLRNLPVNSKEIKAYEDKKRFIKLDFVESTLGVELGIYFEMEKLSSIENNVCYNEQFLMFLHDISHLIPIDVWRYSVDQRTFYLIDENNGIIQFNNHLLNEFSNSTIRVGESSTPSENVHFLNPQHLEPYYRTKLPDNNALFSFGLSFDSITANKVVISNSKNELISIILKIAIVTQLTTSLTSEFIHINIDNVKQSTFMNKTFPPFFDALEALVNKFNSAFDFNIVPSTLYTMKPSGTSVNFSLSMNPIVLESFLHEILIPSSNLSFEIINLDHVVPDQMDHAQGDFAPMSDSELQHLDPNE